MKYKAKDYAKALVDLILQKGKPAEDKKILDNFLKILEKNGDIKKAKEITALAESIYFKKTGKKKIIIETARKIDQSQRNLLRSLEKEGDITEEKINKELIAGIKIIINNEKQFDASMQRKLQKIF